MTTWRTDSVAFGCFVVACVLVARVLLAYTKALIYCRVQAATAGGMLPVAVAQQAGACLGALTFFFLVNYTQGLFHYR